MKIKVLVIEDNEQNMYLVKFILEVHGYEVIQARNGSDGIFMAREHKPDLILLDIQLPILDGYTVARELRKINAMQHVPILAVTSYAMPGDREQALAAGCNGYIEKPINPDTFMNEINQFIQADSNGEGQ